MEFRPSGGRESRKGDTFTMEEAEAAAKADGLVLVRSRTNGEPRPKTYS